VLAIFVAPANGGGVQLDAVSGFYLPVLERAALTECPELPGSTLEQLAREHTYSFSTFQQCVPTGAGTYTPQPNDTFELDDGWWGWEDGTGTIVARELRQARLILDESDWTDELLASDINCPTPDGQDRILGFTILFDPVTGEIMSDQNVIGCIVC
jgi:hypothetical protein